MLKNFLKSDKIIKSFLELLSIVHSQKLKIVKLHWLAPKIFKKATKINGDCDLYDNYIHYC